METKNGWMQKHPKEYRYTDIFENGWTSKHFKTFVRILKGLGFKARKTYKEESMSRAISLEGTGEFEGFLFMGIFRHHDAGASG